MNTSRWMRIILIGVTSAVLLVGCDSRTARVDAYVLGLSADSTEHVVYADRVYDVISKQYDLDVIERLEIVAHIPNRPDRQEELILDEFLALENRQKLLKAKITSMIHASRDSMVEASAVRDLLKGLVDYFSQNSQEDESTVVLLGRFPTCFADTTLAAHVLSLGEVPERKQLHWMVPGARSGDRKVRTVLSSVFNITSHPISVRDYHNCVEMDAADSSMPGAPPVIVISFLSDSIELPSVVQFAKRVAGKGDMLIVREGVDSVARISSALNADQVGTILRYNLQPTVQPRWNSVNYLLKRGFASAARLGERGVSNPVILIVGNMPDQQSVDLAKQTGRGIILDSTDFKRLPDSTSFMLFATRGKEGRTMGAFRVAVERYGFRVASESERVK